MPLEPIFLKMRKKPEELLHKRMIAFSLEQRRMMVSKFEAKLGAMQLLVGDLGARCESLNRRTSMLSKNRPTKEELVSEISVLRKTNLNCQMEFNHWIKEGQELFTEFNPKKRDEALRANPISAKAHQIWHKMQKINELIDTLNADVQTK